MFQLKISQFSPALKIVSLFARYDELGAEKNWDGVWLFGDRPVPFLPLQKMTVLAHFYSGRSLFHMEENGVKWSNIWFYISRGDPTFPELYSPILPKCDEKCRNLLFTKSSQFN